MHSKKRTRNSRKNKRSLHNQIIQRGGDPLATVQILNSDNNKIDIGTCAEDSGIILKNLSGIDNVDKFNKFNKKLLHYINYSLINNYGLNSFMDVSFPTIAEPYILEIITEGDIFGIVCAVIIYRKCICLCVLQFSSRGVRQLCYLINFISHSGFGTTCDIINAFDIISNFAKIKQKLDIRKIPIKLDDPNKKQIEDYLSSPNGHELFGV